MLGAIAQLETEIRAERQMDGINKAKERGVAFGRKRKMTAQQIEELRESRKSMNKGVEFRELDFWRSQNFVVKRL